MSVRYGGSRNFTQPEAHEAVSGREPEGDPEELLSDALSVLFLLRDLIRTTHPVSRGQTYTATARNAALARGRSKTCAPRLLSSVGAFGTEYRTRRGGRS